jgi:hypothetical protein
MNTRFLHEHPTLDEKLESADFILTVDMTLSPMVSVQELIKGHPVLLRFTGPKNIFLTGSSMDQRIKWLREQQMDFKWGRDRGGFVALFANKREAMMFKLVWGLAL